MCAAAVLDTPVREPGCWCRDASHMIQDVEGLSTTLSESFHSCMLVIHSPFLQAWYPRDGAEQIPVKIVSA